MISVHVTSTLTISEDEVYFVDRIGKFGSQTYVCENFAEMLQKVAEIAQMPHVLTICVWN